MLRAVAEHRAARLHPCRGPRVDEQRETPLSEHVKQRATPAVAGLVSNRRCWKLEPDKPAVQLLDEASCVDFCQASRCPAGEWGAQVGNPIVVSVKENLGILRRQVLDAKRAGQPDDRTADAIASRLGRSPCNVMVCGIHLEGRFAGGEQRPAIQPRRPGSTPQLLDEHIRPDMLVNIYMHGAPPLIARPPSGGSHGGPTGGWHQPTRSLKRFTYTLQ
jgi:hypothetical protein